MPDTRVIISVVVKKVSEYESNFAEIIDTKQLSFLKCLVHLPNCIEMIIYIFFFAVSKLLNGISNSPFAYLDKTCYLRRFKL